MEDRTPGDKERALIEGARREAAAKRGPSRVARTPAVAPAPRRTSAPEAGGARTVIGWDHPAAQTTPLDAPTVAGWDHPAARASAPPAASSDKWSQIAALMEQERADARERRRRAQRGVVAFLVILFALVAFASAKILLR